MAVIEAKDRALTDELKVAGGADRVPWFCSGCPHNTSTRVPEGSRAVAGIGCHYMVSWMPGRNTSTFTQMGGEGVPWVGQSAFTTEKHIFTNLGDGTYFHSGIVGDPPEHRRRGQHHLQDPLQRRGRDDRRPAGRRAARGPLGAADHEQRDQRRRGQAHHRHRPAGEVHRRGAGPGRHRAPPRRAGRAAARVPRDPRRHRHHLRPDLRHRKAPPPQARQDGRARRSASSSTSWSAKAVATAVCRAIACPSSRWRPSSAASAPSTRTAATRTTPA